MLISDSCDGHSRVPSDSQREVLLELPGAPTLDEQDASQVRNLLTKRALGPGLIPGTDDRRKTYEELAGQGVEMTQEPVEQPYGIDCAIRDPFGTHIRIPQLAAEMAETTDEVKNRWAGETA